MSNWQEAIKDLVHTGPSNVKRFLEVLEKMPSDSTLNKLAGTLNNLIPMIPRLENLLGNGNIKNLERLLKRVPDSKTVDRLCNAIPMLERIPDKETINRMLEKADSLKGFLDSLEMIK